MLHPFSVSAVKRQGEFALDEAIDRSGSTITVDRLECPRIDPSASEPTNSIGEWLVVLQDDVNFVWIEIAKDLLFDLIFGHMSFHAEVRSG